MYFKKHYTEKLEFESYLSNVTPNLSKYIINTCNYKLSIEAGRKNNVVKNQRFCDHNCN